MGHLICEYGQWIKHWHWINVKFPDIDNCPGSLFLGITLKRSEVTHREVHLAQKMWMCKRVHTHTQSKGGGR